MAVKNEPANPSLKLTTVQRICFLNLHIYKERTQKIKAKASLVQCGNQASCMDFVLKVLVSSWAQTKLLPHEDTTNFCALFQCIQGIKTKHLIVHFQNICCHIFVEIWNLHLKTCINEVIALNMFSENVKLILISNNLWHQANSQFTKYKFTF